MVPPNCDPWDGDDHVIVRTEQRDAEPLVQTVVRGLAAAEDVPVDELGPLYHWIDTNALERLLDHATTARSDVGVEFVVGEHTVVVSSDGTVCVHDGESTVADSNERY